MLYILPKNDRKKGVRNEGNDCNIPVEALEPQSLSTIKKISTRYESESLFFTRRKRNLLNRNDKGTGK